MVEGCQLVGSGLLAPPGSSVAEPHLRRGETVRGGEEDSLRERASRDPRAREQELGC